MQHIVKVRAAIISVLLILLFAGSVFVAFPHLLPPHATYTAYIYQDGNLLHAIPLYPENTSDQALLIGDIDTSYNMVIISNGSVYIKEASCPDQICVKQGSISNSLLPITCLPNHLVIEVKENTSFEKQPDAITY